MADVTTAQIKELRNLTGVSVMQVKKALEEAGGEMEKAKVILQKKSSEIAAKKADRELGAGTVAAYVHNNNSVAAMVELLCETDFVSGNDDFQSVAYDIAMHIAAMNPAFKSEDEISAEDKKVAESVFVEEVADKPAEMQEKILQGKMDAYFKDKVLLNQSFIKDPAKTISDLVAEASQKFGERVELGEFSRIAIK
jgi:elongation factor Ts